MKKFTIGIMAAVFSAMMVLPAVKASAHDWDMDYDANAIHHQRHALHHDYRELREDVRRGDYGAAAHEQAEIAGRREDINRRARDLNSDYYRHYSYDPYYRY